MSGPKSAVVHALFATALVGGGAAVRAADDGPGTFAVLGLVPLLALARTVGRRFGSFRLEAFAWWVPVAALITAVIW